MTAEGGEDNFERKLCVLAYAELKRQLAFVHIFLKISRESCFRKITLNINRQSLEVKYSKRNSLFIHFGDVLFVPTTCYAIQWVSSDEIRFRMQVKELRPGRQNDVSKTVDILNNNDQAADKNGYVRSGVESRITRGPSDEDENELSGEKILDVFKKPDFTFECKCCRAQLLTPRRFDRVCALPSDNWHDIADSIFCHKHHSDPSVASESSTTIQNDVPAKSLVLVPETNDCFVGDTHFMLNGTALLSSSLTYGSKSSLRCSRCRQVVGMVQSAESPHAQKSAHINGTVLKSRIQCTVQSLKVFMHSVQLPWKHKTTLENGSDAEISRDNWSAGLEKQIAQLVLSHCKQYNSYRFVVEARQGNAVRPYLLLWVLETDCEQYWGRASGEDKHGQTQHVPVLKIMYKDCLRDETKALTSGWQADLTVHSIELPSGVCLKLAQMLINSTKQLPQPIRAANGFYVGYLRKGVGRCKRVT